MESEKVKEIKKALECIVNANAPKTEINYYGNLHLDILTLINELESENAELKKYRCDWLMCGMRHLRYGFMKE